MTRIRRQRIDPPRTRRAMALCTVAFTLLFLPSCGSGDEEEAALKSSGRQIERPEPAVTTPITLPTTTTPEPPPPSTVESPTTLAGATDSSTTDSSTTNSSTTTSVALGAAVDVEFALPPGQTGTARLSSATATTALETRSIPLFPSQAPPNSTPNDADGAPLPAADGSATTIVPSSSTTVPAVPSPTTTPPVSGLAAVTTAPPWTEAPPPTLAPPARPGAQGLADSLAIGLTHPGFDDTDVGVMIHVDGLGPAFVRNHEANLVPASNQKLATALAALEYLGPDYRFVTSLQTEGTVRRRTDAPGLAIDGDLVLVGGGDPELELDGADSIATLAQAIADLGIVSVVGDLVIDDTRHSTERSAPGWKPSYIPGSIGPLSALSIGSNRIGSGDEYWADPSAANADFAASALERAGIDFAGRDSKTVAGVGSRTISPTTTPTTAGADTDPGIDDSRVALAAVTSPTVAELIGDLLLFSDNEIAELLLREIGLVASGTATSEAGAAATDDLLERLIGPSNGETSDGSGLSLLNRRSAEDWVRVLRHLESSRWWPIIEPALAVATTRGTLGSRFGETAGAGNVTGKTGTTDDVRSLSGFVTTLAGRRAVFSIVVNRPDLPRASRDAIDALVVRIAGHPG